ncbi:MAG: hypothetical protein JSV62_13940 [Promethearchaeota archaeon]|nr:MAG: hypothetical protein JSV62_13940 [Candidatus Lokiarchaeota archaeon]
MKSKKWRKITLRDPKLRRIRAGIRVLLKLSIQDELEHLRGLQDLYLKKNFTRELTNSEKKRYSFLIKKSTNLSRAWDNSILICIEGWCESKRINNLSGEYATLGEDMVWNPLLKGWICINCYNTKYKSDLQKREFQDLLEQAENEEKKFDDWLKDHS